jgi:hypothetical protein
MCKEKRKNIKEKKRKNKMRARKCVFGLVFMAFDWILWPLAGFSFCKLISIVFMAML